MLLRLEGSGGTRRQGALTSMVETYGQEQSFLICKAGNEPVHAEGRSQVWGRLWSECAVWIAMATVLSGPQFPHLS